MRPHPMELHPRDTISPQHMHLLRITPPRSKVRMLLPLPKPANLLPCSQQQHHQLFSLHCQAVPPLPPVPTACRVNMKDSCRKCQAPGELVSCVTYANNLILKISASLHRPKSHWIACCRTRNAANLSLLECSCEEQNASLQVQALSDLNY
jgi:hypothetical protein